MVLQKLREAILFVIVVSSFATAGCSSRESKEQYKYDSKGRLASRIAPDGGKTTFKYNEQSLPVEIQYPGGEVRYAYDTEGNRLWVKDKTGVTEYYYNAFDRLVGVIWRHSPWQLVVCDYDPWGYLSYLAVFNLGLMKADPAYAQTLSEFERGVPEDAQNWPRRQLKFNELMQRLRGEDSSRKERWLEYEVKYRHDVLGNLTGVDTKEGSIKYSYYPDKWQLERRLPNGIITKFAYSTDGLLKSLRHEYEAREVIVDYQYDYNAAGEIISAREVTPEGTKTTEYIWDDRGYLKELKLPDGNTIVYDYDAMGNRTLKQDQTGSLRYEYDKLGRLIQAGSSKYEWDKNGNSIAQIEANLKTTIQYDGRGLPSRVKTPGSTIGYDWDGDGNMVARQAEKEITHYLPNPLAPPGFTLGEFDSTGSLKSSYLYGDVLLGQRAASGQMQYFLEDGFDSIRHITDLSGRIVGQRDYTPFAEPMNMSGDMAGHFRMAGEKFLPEIKKYIIGGRLYEPLSGRHLTPDLLPAYMGRFDSFNKYAHGCRAMGLFMAPRCNQNSKKRGQESYIDILNRQSRENHYPVDSKGIPGGMGARPLPGERIYVNWDDPIAWWPITPRNLMPIEGGVGWRLFSIEFGPGVSRKQYGWGGHTLREGYGWTGQSPSPGRIEGHSLAEFTLYDMYRSGGYPALEPFAGKTFRGAGWSPLDVGPKEIATGSYTSNFLFDALFLGLPRSFGFPTGRNTGELRRLEKERDERKKPPFPPDGGGGGGLGGLWGPFGGGGGFYDPFKSVESKLGGIELAATAEFPDNLGAITGAVYDPEKQCLVLIGENSLGGPSVRPEDLAVALLLVFGPRPQDPQFTLDPADPSNPRGAWLRAIYIPEDILSSTYFGKTLFDADWLLKQYSFGVRIDEDGKVQERKSSVPGFKSVADLSLEQQGQEYGKEKWARFWIVSDEMKLRKQGNSIYFDVAKMRVKAKKQMPDPSSPSGLRDVDTEDDPVATKFANLFTELYDDIARESPEFERVRELAKAVALAKWLKEQRVPVDMGWVVDYVNKRIKVVDRITAISIGRQKQEQKPISERGAVGIQTIIRQLHLFGGVDLTVNPKHVSDDGRARSLQESVSAQFKQADTAPIFTVESDGKRLQAMVLPITASGKEMWRNSPSIELDETVYQLNDQKKVVKSVGKDGNAAEFDYDSGGALKTVKASNSSGWKLFGERHGNGSSWAATNSRGNTLTLEYDGDGHLNRIETDGQTWASYECDSKGRPVAISYEGFAEKVTYDDRGIITGYEIQSNGASVPQAQKLVLDYDSTGNLIRFGGVGLPSINVSYTEDGVKLAKITTPGAETRYSYDSGGHLKEITHSSGISATCVYDGSDLVKLQVSSRSKQAEYLFNKDGINQSKDFFGGIADYGYSNGRLRSVNLGQYGEANYSYDDKNRLREIRLPDGSRTEYKYESAGSQTQTVSIISYPASKQKENEPRPGQETPRADPEGLPRIRMEDIPAGSLGLAKKA